VTDASFTKIREISMAYRVPADWLGMMPGFDRLSGMNLTLTGRNLFTWTDYLGFDPDSGASGGDMGSAAASRQEGYSYPQFRTFTGTVEIIF
jgi:hypothetical protein